MRTSYEVQEEILQELSHGPAGPFAIASAIGEPAYRVRAELKLLRVDRMVHEILTKNTHLFSLTASGMGRLGGIVQGRLIA